MSYRSMHSCRQPMLRSHAEDVLSRDASRARIAYLEGDADMSRSAHQINNIEAAQSSHPHLEAHTVASSESLKAFVFGGLDGIVTIFAVVAGCMGARLTPTQIIIVGAGNVLADAVSMGFGEYTSAKTERDYLNTERAREQWELDNFPEGEKQEMMEIYIHKHHFSYADAQTIVDVAFKYPEFYISHMMAEELGILDDSQGPSPLKRGVVMFAAFVVFGVIPLAAFVGFAVIVNGWTLRTPMTASSGTSSFIAAAVISCITLYCLGAAKATFLHQQKFAAGLQMTINGGIAGGVAYLVGVILREYIGTDGGGP